jgi:predicted HicB family RNase H-like nuclease
MTTKQPGKRGRPSKGARRQFCVKVPEQLVAALEFDATQRGMDRTAWVVEAIARHLGQPNPFDVQETAA